MVLVEFVRGAGRRHRSVLHRADGVTVELDGGAYNRLGDGAEVPHDLAHLIVEDELGLRRGVWGVLAAGGMFRHATVTGGRRRPHAGRRGRELVSEWSDEVMRAELAVRAVCDAAAGAGGPGSPGWPSQAGPQATARAIARLRAAADAWRALAPGERLVERWDHD